PAATACWPWRTKPGPTTPTPCSPRARPCLHGWRPKARSAARVRPDPVAVAARRAPTRCAIAAHAVSGSSRRVRPAPFRCIAHIELPLRVTAVHRRHVGQTRAVARRIAATPGTARQRALLGFAHGPSHSARRERQPAHPPIPRLPARGGGRGN